MKCIILCCDKYHIFAYHSIKTYEKYLPNNNFTYYLPYNIEVPDFIKEIRRETGKRIKLIKTGIEFKKTMLKLLSDVDDEEFVYWCSSDTYIEQIDSEKFYLIKKLIEEGKFNQYDVISLFRNKKLKNKESFLVENIEFINCNPWTKPDFNIWQHQFMKGKILKAIWNSFDEPNNAKELDYQLCNKNHRIYKNKTFINCKNIYLKNAILKLGENTSRGMVTINSINSFDKLGIDKKLIKMKISNNSLIWS